MASHDHVENRYTKKMQYKKEEEREAPNSAVSESMAKSQYL